ncbi:hypothetical protein GCM10010964_14750 [Caldovatus sediminis]|uniref:HTH marR-type domain-containing protein n=1 Tax=Caldovatus sediminis TaxID=2041189 RepID=A0A8J3EBX3_9PROT|nr:hypothetical protein GCM10010964_14750 [Caldovatus sediminis]
MSPSSDPSRRIPIGGRQTGLPLLWNAPAADRRRRLPGPKGRSRASRTGGAAPPGAGATLDPLRLLVRALVPGVGRDLTLRQLAVLLVVHDGEEPRTCCALADMLAIPRPAMTRALDRLTALDLVRRVSDPACRRNVLVSPTPGGWAFLGMLRDRLVGDPA